MSNLVADEFLAEKVAAIRLLATSLARDVAEIGRHLSEVKEHFGRGDNPKFLAWASDTLTWSKTTVYRYLEIYEFVRAGNFPNVGKIDLDLRSLYLLAAPSTTDEARTEILEQAKIKKVTRAVVKKTVARHAKPKAKKAPPEPAPVIIETKAIEPEPQYMLVPPEATPPIVHVDSVPADNFMAEHQREELVARDEEIEQLKSTISDLKAEAIKDRKEIDELRAARAGLEDRLHRTETERYDEFAAFLLHYCGRNDAETKTLMEGAQEFLPEVFEALERRLAARQEPGPDLQTWEKSLTSISPPTGLYRRIIPNSSPQRCIGRTIMASMSRNLAAVAVRKQFGTPRPRIAASRALGGTPIRKSAKRSCGSLVPESLTVSPR
jgi:hypothetical protein